MGRFHGVSIICEGDTHTELDCQKQALIGRSFALVRFCIEQCSREGEDRCTNCDVDRKLRELGERKRRLLATSLSAETVGWMLRNVMGVRASWVYANGTDTVNEAGLPPYSIKVVVEGGSDEDVAKALFNVPLGTEMCGEVEVVHRCEVNGSERLVRFSRPS